MPFATAALLGLMALGQLLQVVIANNSDGGWLFEYDPDAA